LQAAGPAREDPRPSTAVTGRAWVGRGTSFPVIENALAEQERGILRDVLELTGWRGEPMHIEMGHMLVNAQTPTQARG
jgi:hypothetical protein